MHLVIIFLEYDYDSFAAPDLHIAFFRIIHGLLIVFFIRDLVKSIMKRILAKAHRAPITASNVRTQSIEVPLTFTVYSIVGFSVVFVVPAINKALGLYK